MTQSTSVARKGYCLRSTMAKSLWNQEKAACDSMLISNGPKKRTLEKWHPTDPGAKEFWS